MSDLLFNEVPVTGDTYKPGDWKLYAVHNEKQIKGFFGPFKFLANFEMAPCSYQGIIYPTIENAYQAAKLQPAERIHLITCSALEAKKNWKNFKKIEETEAEWDARKENVMSEIIFSKFLLNPALRQKLIDTGTAYLEETNHWQDLCWGVDIKLGGENRLGKILMRLRNYWKEQSFKVFALKSSNHEPWKEDYSSSSYVVGAKDKEGAIKHIQSELDRLNQDIEEIQELEGLTADREGELWGIC
jgi:ribA/ribD-fused uncharacterized protein